MLRVLVVLPFYGGSLPVGRFAVQGLREAGCLVDVFEAPSFYPAYEAINELRVGSDRLDAVQNNFLHFISQAVLAKVDAFAPDMVLALAQAPLSRPTLKRLKREGVLTAMWFVEDFRLFTYWRAFAPLYDIFAVIQKEPFMQELAHIGVEHAPYLPLAALPSLHRPLELDPAEKKEFGSPLSFVGAGYANRRKAFVQLLDQGLKIWGTEWDGEAALTPALQRNGARISSEDCVRIFNASLINLNLHSHINAETLVSRGDFVNPRTFEIAACEAFQLVDRRTLLPELFAEDELALFDSLEELKDLIRHYRDRPEERSAMAARARVRVLSEHTYAVRMKSLLDYAGAHFPAFGERKSPDWPQNMPEEMRTALEDLTCRFNLPATASFSDVVSAVRTGSEELSELDSALLFLDEWRKLYIGNSS
ncbi:glycosyltransferase [Desulfovibrio sp. OttesenSCG-928-F20]|nr:glycosyltransferase [Desulfovibrio sp. OttesenSCG-928-F20]